MKKYIFGGIAVLTVVAAAALNINFNTQKSDLSGISLANVEALADFEVWEDGIHVATCSGTSGTCYTTTLPNGQEVSIPGKDVC